MKAFAAATSDDFNKSKLPDYHQFYSILGLNMFANPSLSEINRAYRKAALKVHPDKGGDLAEVQL
jgi:curved DNA-binding protein CbpA